MAEVRIEMKVWVVDPDGMVQVEGHIHEAPTERGHEVDPLPDHLANRGKSLLAAHVAGVQDQHRRYVHVVGGRLKNCERGIDAGQSLHDDVAFRFRQRPRLAI